MGRIKLVLVGLLVMNGPLAFSQNTTVDAQLKWLTNPKGWALNKLLSISFERTEDITGVDQCGDSFVLKLKPDGTFNEVFQKKDCAPVSPRDNAGTWKYFASPAVASGIIRIELNGRAGETRSFQIQSLNESTLMVWDNNLRPNDWNNLYVMKLNGGAGQAAVKAKPLAKINQQPIYVYTITGCMRCEATLSYLRESDINYVEYNTTVDEKANGEMWNKLHKSGKFKGGNVTTPIVDIGGDIYFDMPDIDEFISELPTLVKAMSGRSSGQATATPSVPKEQAPVGKGAANEPENMKGMTDRHNYWRQQVGVKPLVWSNKLAEYANQWAQELARKGCQMEHRPNDGKWARIYGENLFWMQGTSATPQDVVDSWADEKKYYNPKSGKCEGGVCGHYTQVVWAQTTEVGCAVAQCGDSEIWVCNYNPAGNYNGQKPY